MRFKSNIRSNFIKFIGVSLLRLLMEGCLSKDPFFRKNSGFITYCLGHNIL